MTAPLTAPSFTVCAELLLTEQHRRDPAALLPASNGPFPADPDEALVAVCAALAAGLPGLALRLLDRQPPLPELQAGLPDRHGTDLPGTGDLCTLRPGPDGPSPLRRALRTAALALRDNWFPGDVGVFLRGPVVDDSLPNSDFGNDVDICDDLRDVPDTSPEHFRHLSCGPLEADPGTVAVLADLLARIRVARSIVADVQGTATDQEAVTLTYLIGDSSTTSLDGAGLVAAVGLTADAVWRLDTLGWPPACAYARVLHADLLHRIGNDERAGVLLERTRRAVSHDRTLRAHCALVEGDWAASPDSHPATFDLLPTGTGPRGRRHPDTSRAAERWRAAERLYSRTGSCAGRAAARLRLSTLPDGGRAGNGPAEHLPLAAREARRARDTSLHTLALVHGIVEEARATGSPAGTVPDQLHAVADWALGDGSPSYGRGLCRLLNAHATRSREEGDLVGGRKVLRHAVDLAGRLDEPVGPHLVQSDVVDLFGGDTYLLLTAALHLLDLERVPPEATDSPRAWVHRAHDLMVAVRHATAVESPQLLSRACDLLSAHLRDQPPSDRGTDPITPLIGPVNRLARQSVSTGPGLAALFEGVADLAAGLVERSAAHLDRTLQDPRQNDYVRSAALIHSGRQEEAEELVRDLVDRGTPPGPSIDMLLRIGDADAAARRFPLRPVSPDDPGTRRPWEDLSRLAQIRLAQQDPDRATALAYRALALYEERLLRLSRDLLRTPAGDDPTVARAYLTAVVGNILMADRAQAAGDPRTARTLRATALRTADRARSGLRIPAAPGDPVPRRELAEWLRRSTGWSAAVESVVREVLAGRSPCPARTRAEIDRAESALALAEAPLVRREPGDRPVRVGDPWDRDETLRCLEAGTVLLEYHHYDTQLVVFALTGDGLRSERTTIRPYQVEACVHDLYRELATGTGDSRDHGGGACAARLSELLLDPVREAVSAADRILIVPTGVLSRVPWHLLPAEGGELGRGRPVSFLPACGPLPRLARGGPVRTDRGALVLGDPADAVDGTGRSLPVLPGARAEARAVARLHGGTALVGRDATRRALTAGTQDGPVGVLHLACHCGIDGRWPHLSHVSLCGGERMGLGDLVAACIGCDLVVLSVCTLGEFRAVDGGDLTGLARALFAVGVRHLVAPLWPVDDRTGCLFAVDLTRRILAGATVAHAVHAAREALRTQDPRTGRATYRELLGATGARSVPVPVRRTPVPDGTGTAPVPSGPLSWASWAHIGL